jgi:hypothetical protein
MSQIPKILQDLYLKNIKFFETQNPSIHHVISNLTPDHSKIIISDSGDIDLRYNGKNIYGGDAIKYVQNEVQEFNNIYSPKKRSTSSTAIYPNLYNGPRFFHQHLNKAITKLYKVAENIYPNALHTDNRHDFIVVMGVGLGLHISELLDQTNVQNLLILETDFELLALSCFFTDWEDIYRKQESKNNKSISLVLVNKTEQVNEQGGLWNELIKRVPHFPFNTVYYNHGRHNKYGEIIRNISSDTKMFMSLWGFYDDETNQLNHILHNINQHIKLIPKKKDFSWDKPVIVCGSGPSLDLRMEQLKSIREDCVLISAGTSLSILLNNNIVPDFHMEIESDYGVLHALNAANKSDALKDITLICALQCSPLITTLFKDCYAFIKDSMSIGDIIEKTDDKLIDPTPTCVNAALAIAMHYRSAEIYLFGTDFGFYNRDNHHSENSIYHQDNDDTDYIRSANKKNMDNNFVKPGYNGDCMTTDLYFTTKRRVEVSIRYFKSKYAFKVINLSDGLIIDQTEHKNIDEELIINPDLDQRSVVLNRFYSKTRRVDKNIKQKLIKGLHNPVKDLCVLISLNLKEMNPDIESLSALSWSISNYLSNSFKNKHGTLCFFIRGTFWHYLSSGYTISYACEPSKQADVIDLWRNEFIDFLEKLPDDLLQVINKQRSSIGDDPQLTRTIMEAIPEEENEVHTL